MPNAERESRFKLPRLLPNQPLERTHEHPKFSSSKDAELQALGALSARNMSGSVGSMKLRAGVQKPGSIHVQHKAI